MKPLKQLLLDNLPIVTLLVVIVIFFYPFILHNKIPIAADTIVGLYHPFRDKVWNNLTSGVPVKNPLITDPVRQQYVWRFLGIENLRKLIIPAWNPYSFSGTPLIGNFQSAVFYPLNILFFLLSFNWAWAILVISQPFLSGIFLYAYLRYINVSKWGSLIGSLSFALSGFTVAWFTWNTIIHTVLWLPLILLSIEHLLKKITRRWILIVIFAMVSQILAGHLQILFYSLILYNAYLLIRIIQLSFHRKISLQNIIIAVKKYNPFFLIGLIVLLITSIQWIPALKLISLSARAFDQGSFTKPGWFIPTKQLIQFLIPDFFGNPSTGNYWGEWNYGEFIGYIGIIPFILSIYALFFRHDKKVMFFGSVALIGLLFALPTPLARLPFQLNIPLISTSQPTRLMYIVDFALCILAGLGFDAYQKNNSYKKLAKVIIPISIIFIVLWLITELPTAFRIGIPNVHLAIAQRNLIFPTFILLLSLIYLIFYISKYKFKNIFLSLIFVTLILDLLRFGWKFTPFTESTWLFPETNIIKTLKTNAGTWRILSTDRRIMPPNFSVYYHFHDIAGYDPLYTKRYGEFIAAWGRGKPDISPASFNRIITPQDFSSPFADLLGVKFILSLKDEESPKLKLIEKEGETRLYENTNVMPRVFLVNNILKAISDQDEIEKLFSVQNQISHIATTQEDIELDNKILAPTEFATFTLYLDNEINIDVNVVTTRLLILSDIYYPTWNAFIDGQKAHIYKVDYTLRGVIIPKGNHIIKFKNSLI